MSQPIEIWFEFASTYSYPAVMRVEQVCADAGITLAWRPFLLGPVFAAQGLTDSPFNLNPLKGRYMWRDIVRICAAQGVPFRHPSAFPRGSLLASRIACASAAERWVGEFIRSVFTANFADDREIGDTACIADILRDLGQDADALIARSTTDAAKYLLRSQTDRALQMGLFGAPSFVVGRELFWGNDRLEEAVHWSFQDAPGAA